ncbi:MAG: molybdopterin-guanine dinucleotide biosynthesis protein B [Pirellulaceae bacterium]|nr:molybdopterin-guanine dinucleotide biosynthesis protein B [Planctomycetales bacterium]
MHRIHIIGRKNSGKTTLIVDLVQQLTGLGLRVATIKHTHHRHELDTPGKDSFLHRQAGAVATGILSKSMNAIFWPPDASDGSDNDVRYDSFAPMFANCQLVLVEGDTQTSACKIEVWRAALNTRPYAEGDPSVTAVVTDDELDIGTRVWPRSDIRLLAQNMIGIFATDP